MVQGKWELLDSDWCFRVAIPYLPVLAKIQEQLIDAVLAQGYEVELVYAPSEVGISEHYLALSIFQSADGTRPLLFVREELQQLTGIHREEYWLWLLELFWTIDLPEPELSEDD